jgi:hypothetical protein
VSALGKDYHKLCLKCEPLSPFSFSLAHTGAAPLGPFLFDTPNTRTHARTGTECRKQLELGKFAERDGRIYCKQCHSFKFGDKGYGYGGGGGTLSSYTPSTAAKESTLDMRPMNAQAQQQQPRYGSTPGARSPTAPASASAPSGGRFCSSCGNNVQGQRFCSSCGKPNN